MDYYEALKKLYIPQFGSLWQAPNKIWKSGFASGADGNKIHPSVVEKLRMDGVTISLVPGTTKDYRKGSCVYKVDLGNSGQITHFLIDLSMPYTIDDVKELKRSWNGIDELNVDQKEDFKRQIRYCRG
jgi:hypothetical protein